MNKFFKLKKLILQTLFLYIFLLTSSSISLEKNFKRDLLSNYFSGVISLQNNKYNESYNFLKKMENFEDNHVDYSYAFVETLINNSRIDEAYRYSYKLRKKGMNFFQSDIIIISKLIKNKNFQETHKYLNSISTEDYTSLQKLLAQIVLNWTKLEKSNLTYNQAQEVFKEISPKYKNLKRINDIFLNCYFDTSETEKKFQNLINDQTTDFSRYTYFYINYLLKKDSSQKAHSILNLKLQDAPRNLLLNQVNRDLKLKKKKYLQNIFDCKNISNVIAELFYITANALSTQNLYSFSNFYINLAKYLNPNFYSYNTLLAENFIMVEEYKKAEDIYLTLKKLGEYYAWYSSKQIAFLEIKKSKINQAIKTLEQNYNDLNEPDLYQTYDFAEFLKNNEKFNKSIKYYSIVLQEISKSHELFPKAKDGRGIDYERT